MCPDNNFDAAEISKFDELAHRWWDPNSEFKTLHDINPLRLNWIEEAQPLHGKKMLDVGCGGGLIAEGMAARGAEVCGIDLSPKLLSVARMHLALGPHRVDYRLKSAEELAQEEPGTFDGVVCMEMLEHVPSPESVVAACAKLVKPGGLVFFSTLNRTPLSYLLAIVGAEYVLRLLPQDTHDYKKFIRPSELDAYCRHNNLRCEAMAGLRYIPLISHYSLTKNVQVNYFYRARSALT